MALPTTPSTTPITKRVAVESWAADAAAHLPLRPAPSISKSPRGTSAPLHIPLDTPPPAPAATPAHLSWTPGRPPPTSSAGVPRRTPSARDSLARRDALLKGGEGSRRRRRWENDRLIGVPGAAPPGPEDFVHPGHGRREEWCPVPYWVAPLWEGKYASLSLASERRRDAVERGRVVPRELRERLRKARGAKGLLIDLEMRVREFLEEREEEEEIVFVGRDGGMEEGRRMERLVFQSLERDRAASFGRWLVHSIADYYGLETWSVTTGNPARREAYVGLKATPPAGENIELPRPLWVMV